MELKNTVFITNQRKKYSLIKSGASWFILYDLTAGDKGGGLL